MLSQPATLTPNSLKLHPGLHEVVQLPVCESIKIQSPSFLNDIRSPSNHAHTTATCTLYFFLTLCNHTTFSWPSPVPATAPRAVYTTRGYGKDKHMRNITELPTHLTAGGQTSFPNSLACAGGGLSRCPCLHAFSNYNLSKGNFAKCQYFYQNSL